ncbi:MAG: DUF975 family protein [Bacillota bacterium]|nr:DUF975 family protein [Bacillota bacterium]
MSYIRAELKKDAKSQLMGNWGKAIGAMLLVALFGIVISMVFELLLRTTSYGMLLNNPEMLNSMSEEAILGMLPGILGWSLLFSVAVLVLTAPVSIGYCFFNLGLMRGENVSAVTPFQGFRYLGGTIGLTVLMSLFLFLWSLLLYIPGIVKSLSYAMAPYIWSDNREMSARDAITQSRKMMVGHKWELFVLTLSFIPWLLLVAVTCGLGALYVQPYMEVTFVNFYERLKNDYALEA